MHRAQSGAGGERHQDDTLGARRSATTLLGALKLWRNTGETLQHQRFVGNVG